MQLVWKYIPRGMYSHVVTDSWEPFRRALCGVAPLTHLITFDSWHPEPTQETPRRCELCAVRLEEYELAKVQLAQEGRSF